MKSTQNPHLATSPEYARDGGAVSGEAGGSLKPFTSLAITVDVEDYFHVASFGEGALPSLWDAREQRVVASSEKVLDILDEHSVKGTFFVLGWVASKHPQLIRQIQSRGHEIASHGFHHGLVYDQKPEEFRVDVRKSKSILEDLTGARILGYRAPTFSITARSAWAHRVLADEGYEYSSSVFPVVHDRYGWPQFGQEPRFVETGDGAGIWEFPLPRVKLGRFYLPFGGGGYLRIWPLWLTRHLLRRRSENTSLATICYIHPWELDPDQPRLPGPLLSRLRHYWGLPRTESRVHRLFEEFSFCPLSSFLGRDSL